MTDKRIPLSPHDKLPFPGMECRIESLVGKGANSIVYLGSYPDANSDKSHIVLIKELFPYDRNNLIYRDDSGSICVDEQAYDYYLLNKESFLRAINIHLSLLKTDSHVIDGNINTLQYNNTFYSILGYSGGRTLEAEQDCTDNSDCELITHTERILKALYVLGRFHSQGFIHLDISPDNILLIGDQYERVSLIDYNSVLTLEEIRNSKNIYYSIKEGFTSPEVLSGRSDSIGEASDLFSLTAVFYYCITGRHLTNYQILSNSIPDITEVPCVKKMPPSVVALLCKIIKKGLSPSVIRRYHTVREMEADLKELKDRVIGRGITQWALWESFRKRANEIIRINPALNYISSGETYPISVGIENGETVQFDNLKSRIEAESDIPYFITGSGGIGKTTLMLKLALSQSSRYDEKSAVYTYISLYGWNCSGDNNIKNKLLENLRFKSETQSFEDARHELINLLSSPIGNVQGTKPKLVILLDGWNEIASDSQNLMREINELCLLKGVRIVIAGRTSDNTFKSNVYTVNALSETEVRQELSLHGMLLPESDDIIRILKIPMMLSFFINTTEKNGGLIQINSENDLFEQYLNVLCCTGNSEKINASSVILSVATDYVLAEIARYEEKIQRSLTEKELFKIAEKCYSKIKKRQFKSLFPLWTGHYNEIIAKGTDADAWFGLVVYEVLWHKLGLLIKEDDNRYRIFHQSVRDYLSLKALRINKNLCGKTALMHSLVLTSAGLIVFITIFSVMRLIPKVHITDDTSDITVESGETVLKTSYKTEYANSIIQDVEYLYLEAAIQYENLTECIELAQTDLKTFEYKYNTYLNNLLNPVVAINENADEDSKLSALLASGDVMPWSKQAFAIEDFKDFHVLVKKRRQLYASYLTALNDLRSAEDKWNNNGTAFCESLQALLDADAMLTGSYYKILLYPEISGMESNDQEDYLYMIKYYKNQYSFTQSAEALIYDGDAFDASLSFNSNFGYLLK